MLFENYCKFHTAIINYQGFPTNESLKNLKKFGILNIRTKNITRLEDI